MNAGHQIGQQEPTLTDRPAPVQPLRVLSFGLAYHETVGGLSD